MNTLRAKIALLLVVAIVSVVGSLTWVMIALLGPPPPQRTTEPLGGSGRDVPARGKAEYERADARA